VITGEAPDRGPEAGPSADGRPRAVLFDLYGTLIDIRTDENDPGVYAALSQYLAYVGVAIGGEELQQEYRRRVREALAQSPEPYPEVDVHDVFTAILQAYRRDGDAADSGSAGGPAPPAWSALSTAFLFRALTRRAFDVFPGAREALAALASRYRLGLVSDAQWVFTEPELRMAGLAALFPVRALSSRLGVKKPDPRIFAAALRALETSPADAVYVGDNPERDLTGARGIGMRCVLFGSATLGGQEPDGRFQRYEELEAILQDLLR
jgi:putative hydrolase of the HAD superfamily